MRNLTKYLSMLGCLVCLNGSILAADSDSVAQIDTNIPSPDGALTVDQTPPILLPKNTAPATPSARTPVAAPAAAQPAAGTPSQLR